MKKIPLILLSLIILIAAFLRFYNLTLVPPGLTANEAAIGVNANSILQTGRDEFGKIMPLVFTSFGDYKLGLPIYITVPSIATFGLNEFGVRFVPAVFGVLSVILIYFLSISIFKRKLIALLSAFLLAISPWAIQISRMDTPVSLGITLMLALLITIFGSFSKNKKLAVSVLIMILLFFTHPAFFVIVPVFLIIWSIMFLKKLDRVYSIGIISLVTILISLVIKNPLEFCYLRPAFFNEIGFINRVNQLQGYDGTLFPAKFLRLIENKYLLFFDQISKNYLKSFDFYYLFSKASYTEKYTVYSFGKMFYPELVMFLIALYFIVKRSTKEQKLLLIFLLLSPLAGLLRIEPNHPQSLFIIMITFYLFVSLGVVSLAEAFRRNWLKQVFIGGFVVLIFLYMTTFMHYYIRYYSLENLRNWNGGIQQVYQKTEPLKDSFSKIIISDRVADYPYIFYLFYNKINPSEIQSLNQSGDSPQYKYRNYEFRSIDWEKDKSIQGSILVGTDEDIKLDVQKCDDVSFCHGVLEQIILPDKQSILIYEYKSN